MSLESLQEASASASFRGFRCWNDDEVRTVLNPEAAAVSKEVLLATHVAPTIHRVTRIQGAFESLGEVEEDDLLALVQAPPDDSLIVPIIGASGSGKSHLVLWLRQRLPKDPQRRVIYLPKADTSLTGVIDRLLDGHSGGKFDELREAVRHASSTMTDRERALRLRADLAIRVEQTASDDPMRKWVAEHLPALLNDAAFESYLLDTGGALHRVVTEAARGGLDERTDFRPEDLDVDLPGPTVEDLGAKAKAVRSQMRRDRRVLETAIALLNEHRDRSLSRVFGVDPMELFTVMADVRKALFAENPDQRLLLMIEDFTLLQGIQYDLLEAMIDPPRREGELVMAPMTVVMAVTDGFFADLLVQNDTLRTRIEAQGHTYSLDAAYADDGESAGRIEQAQVREFVGRYLNAARAGADDVMRVHPDVPNACERCALSKHCHDAFGTDGDGRGLYPFNAPAIERMVRSRGAKFNPRNTLAALRDTLVNFGSDLAEGRFPSPTWEKSFDVPEYRRRLPSLSISVDRAARATAKGDQRAVLLTFWGDVPDELVDLAPGIHEAFAIPAAAGRTQPTPSSRAEPARARRAVIVDDENQVGERLRRWRDGERLDDVDARAVRRFVTDAMVQALDGEARLLSHRSVTAFNWESHVIVQRSEAGGARRTLRDRFTIEVNADTHGIFLVEGILRAYVPREKAAQQVATANWTFPGGLDHLAALLAFGAEQAERYAHHLRTRATLERRDREAILQTLYYSGLVLGLGNTTSPEGRLTAVFAGTTGAWQNAPEPWRNLAEGLESDRAKLRDTVTAFNQVRQGTGGELALDTTEVTPLLRDAADNVTLGEGPDLPTFRAISTRLTERLDPVLDAVHDLLAQWNDVVAPLLGTGDEWAAVEAELESTAKALQGRRQPLQVDGVRNNMPPVRAVAKDLRDVADTLRQWDGWSPIARARQVGKLPWVRLAPIQDYAARWDRELRAVRDRVQPTGATNGAGTPRTDLERALDGLRTTLDDLVAEAQA